MKFFGLLVCLCLCLLPGSALAGAGGHDPSFGEGGLTSSPLETAARGSVEIGVGPDGSAVVGSPSSYLVRFGPDGGHDLAFGEGGKLSLQPDPLAEGVATRAFGPSNFVVDGAGRLLVFGGESDSSHAYTIPGTYKPGFTTATESTAVVLRYDAEGKPDPTFGAGQGFVRSTFGVHSELHGPFPMVAVIAGQVDSKDRPVLVVGGTAVELGCYAGPIVFQPEGVVRLTEAGAVEGSFGDGGVAPISGSSSSPALALDAKDRPAFVLGQYLRPELNCRAGTGLARLRADGKPLGSFGSHGTEELPRNLHLAFVTPAGAMVLSHRVGRTLELVRLGITGRRDEGFGVGGEAKVRLPAAKGARIRAIGVDAKGRILLVGRIGVGGPYPVLNPKGVKHASLAVGRLLPDGRLDRSFGEGGWILDRIPGSIEIDATAASLDPQGRLLVAATVTAPGQSAGGYLLARFLLGPT
jgi:uncharacterized delta-60 repeat protein